MLKPTIRGEKKTFSVCLPSSIARPTRFRASISFARVLVPFKRLLRRPKFSFFRVTYLFFQMIIVCLNGVKLVAHLSSCLLKVVYLKKNALITFYGIISRHFHVWRYHVFMQKLTLLHWWSYNEVSSLILDTWIFKTHYKRKTDKFPANFIDL